jgi:DNA-binding transcriptional ArsR family regulator
MVEEVTVTAMSAGTSAVAADDALPAPASASALPPPEGTGASLFAARPSLIRAMNEQLLMEHIRQRGPCSRAELARVSGLSKPTVSLALDNMERSGLVRPTPGSCSAWTSDTNTSVARSPT